MLLSHCWGGDVLHVDTSHAPLCFVEEAQLDEATDNKIVIFQCFSHSLTGIEIRAALTLSEWQCSTF